MEDIGIQLYTLRHEMNVDFEGTLQSLAQIGYTEVEFAGYFERTPEQVAETLEKAGLSAPSAHVSMRELRHNLDGVIAAALAIGHRYIVLPWVSNWDYRTARQFEDLARFCNEVGAACKKAGLQFAYHNHDFEFRKDRDKVLYDILLEQTDAKLVALELDLYWTAKAGVDSLAYMKKFPGRFPMVHVKDMDAQGEMVDVGAGGIDFARLLPEARSLGTQHFFVEHDNPDNALSSARNGYKALAAL